MPAGGAWSKRATSYLSPVAHASPWVNRSVWPMNVAVPAAVFAGIGGAAVRTAAGAGAAAGAALAVVLAGNSSVNGSRNA